MNLYHTSNESGLGLQFPRQPSQLDESFWNFAEHWSYEMCVIMWSLGTSEWNGQKLLDQVNLQSLPTDLLPVN